MFSSASLPLVGDNNSLVHEQRAMTAVALTTYCTWHPVLKSVYEKRQSVMSGKLFSSFLYPQKTYKAMSPEPLAPVFTTKKSFSPET